MSKAKKEKATEEKVEAAPVEEKPVEATPIVEKPAEEVPAKEEGDEPHSDFADEEKPLPVPEEEKKEVPPEEVKPVEPEVNLHKEEEEAPVVAPVAAPEEVKPEEAPKEEKPADEGNPDKVKAKTKKPAKPAPIKYEYADEHLAAIETDRLAFYKEYKKSNIWKYCVSGLCIAIIIVGYILPLQIAAWKQYQMAITLSVLAVGVIGLGVFSYISRKKIEAKMRDYFKEFYKETNEYVFSNPEIANLNGAVENKLPTDVFNASKFYKDVAQVGSRASYQFEYKGIPCAISDAAGQVRGNSKGALATIFVGKFIQCPNTYKGGTCIVYLKGNSRALPPTNLAAFRLIEDHRDMVVYGEEGAKRALTKKVRDAIAQFRTNDTLCDVSISIQEGHTYIALGYEDTLMVLPMDKPFNPAPTTQYHDDFAKVLKLIDALNYKEQ